MSDMKNYFDLLIAFFYWLLCKHESKNNGKYASVLNHQLTIPMHHLNGTGFSNDIFIKG